MMMRQDVERSVSVARGSLMKREVFSPKCIVLISHWPFVNVFNQFLCVLYRISRSRSPLPGRSLTSPSSFFLSLTVVFSGAIHR